MKKSVHIGWLCVALMLTVFSAEAAINVSVTGPNGSASQSLPDAGGAFDVNLPLSANALNEITVTATDSRTNVISKTIKIAQLSLQSIVVSQIRTTPLSVQQIEQLVNDGVIQLDNPANFNVSQFAIVLTIGGQEIPIEIPVVMSGVVEETGNEDTPPLSDPGRGSSNPSVPDVTIIQEIISVPGPAGPEPLTIPAILVIEGRIKSLKEFYSVRMLLMNISGIFTLSDVTAMISFPDGGLSTTLPADGLADFGDILPGDAEVPGQKEREFIIRGDEIGERRVQIDFGGVVTGPGIPDDAPIPFNGAGVSSVEVKGPPNFLVEVTHPDAVTAFVPYELIVKITNAGQAPALYTTFDLGVGFAGEIIDCTVDPVTTNSVCTNTPGPVTRKLGHIFPGQTVSQTFTINPFATGPISSCLGISDQNINLQVHVGVIGCLTGHFPPTRGVPDGIPTVAVVPGNNQLGVSVTAPVAAFFSENMETSTISTASFEVFTGVDEPVPGQLHFQSILGRTVAIWQPLAGVLNDNTDYRVFLSQDITDQDGNPLFNEWSSAFRTTSSINDMDPPELSLTILPPVDANFVLPGQVIPVRAYAADQGSGIAHVELYAKDLNVSTGLFEHIDDKSIFGSEDLPVTFSVDSANLVPGHSYLFKGSAFDRRGNVQDATIAAIIAASADPPVIVLPPDPTNDVLYGVSVSLTPVALTGGVKTVDYFLDGETNAFATMFVPPYQTSLSTFQLDLTSHVVRAVATDGLGQTGDDFFAFNLITNASEPVVSFIVPLAGAIYLTNETIAVSGIASDLVGVASVQFFLDSLAGPVLSTNTQPFSIAATNLAPGPHEVIMLVTNNLGTANNTAAPASRRAFTVVATPPGPPPPAPAVTNITDPDAGETLVNGTGVASARITIVNTNQGLTIFVDASAAGEFAGAIAANGGDVLELTAQQLSLSPLSSATTTVVVPVPPVVTNLLIAPASRLFTVVGEFQDFTVTAQLAGGGTSNVTNRSSFSSGNAGVASANQAGRMVAQANGVTTLTATFKTNNAAANITVNIVTLTNIVVSPSSLVLVFTGETQQITVNGQFSNGNTSNLTTSASFANSDPAVISVSSAGLVTAVADGNAQVYVSAGGLPPVSMPISVVSGLNPAPQVDITSPANGTEVEPGDPLSIIVNAQDPIAGVTKIFLTVTGAVTLADNRQISPPASNVTRSFDFTIPTNAQVGGVFVAKSWAQDIAGLTSVVKSVTLNLVDDTPPSALLLSPAPGSQFNAGHTVTVIIAASDNVGVTEVGYTTAGALNQADSVVISPAALATNVALSFIVPPGAPQPELFIFGTARDAAGNSITSSPVQVELTGADITPPSTIVTAIAPPNGATAVVSYTVLDGFDDLDYVQIFFRRNGIGTFSLYTETSGTNILGRYFPQSGTNGTVVFDSTQMGGDGAYEFYSVGVDENDNRELAPTNIFDQATNFSAGTVWIDVVSSTNIGASDVSLDNANLRISNAVVTIEGTHTFKNVDLLGTSLMTHASTTLTNEPAFNVTCWTLSVVSNASVGVNALGYLGGGVNGNDCTGNTTNNANGATPRSAGSHGGAGGSFGGVPNPIYGNVTQPTDMGSGGSCSTFGQNGGNGGGRIRFDAINVAADGALSANGGNPSGGNQAGSGSGGSIYMVTRTLSGLGAIRANGAAFEVGGGGGRVGIHYVDVSTKDLSLITALGGQGGFGSGGNGTVFLKGLLEGGGTLIIDGQGVASPFTGLPIPQGFSFDNIIIRNNARSIVDDPIIISNSLQVLTGSILTHSVENTNGLIIQARSVFVDATSSIDVVDKGYRGGTKNGNPSNNGLTLNGQTGSIARSAGSYGGLGGVFDGGPAGPVYGSPDNPVYLGAGGSASTFGQTGGNGGGRVTIDAADSVTIMGKLNADGGIPNGGNQAGSGSGGSIKINTSLLQGSGSISANGGVFEVGGGGGRIAIHYSFIGTGTNGFNGLRNITAAGGKGNWRVGSAGTVHFKGPGQTYGDLYLDECVTNVTSSLWTPLTPVGLGTVQGLSSNELVMDGAVRVLPGGLVGLKLKPNVNHPAEFSIAGNTATTITVVVSGGTNLTDVANLGDRYAAHYRFDNVYFRRGAFVATSDRLTVDGTLRVEENGVLTHFDSTTNYEPGLELTVGTLDVKTNGQINVDARGYVGGQNGNGLNVGQTLNNATGSTPRSAGSYGGLGGIFNGVPNAVYGDLTAPVDLGSGGSASTFGQNGGDGGGRLRIVATDVQINGVVTASGGELLGGNQAGSGSGGSIYITAGTLSGAGTVRANGGAFEVGGGGGRVAIHYSTLNMTQGQFHAFGGQGNFADGGNGSVYFKSTLQTYGDYVIDGANVSTPVDSASIPSGFTFDNLIIRNLAQVVASSPIVVVNSLQVLNGSALRHSQGLEAGLVISAASILVDSNSTIDVSARGYAGGARPGNPINNGVTLNGQTGSFVRSAGSYGGLGGHFDGAGGPSPVYGTPDNPMYLGAGGSASGFGQAGGYGGGRLTINATDSVTIQGSLNANGGVPNGGNQAGSGSGGSIKINTSLLQGSGLISANGGVFEVGGGGGRIAINYNVIGTGTNGFNVLRNITAAGGKGNHRVGSAGTVLFKGPGQAHGDLYLDEALTNVTGSLWTPLTPIGLGTVQGLSSNELVLDGAVRLLPGGLVGLQLQPSRTNPALFTIVGNSATTITVSVSSGTNLTDVANVGDRYAANYRFDNVFFRRGAFVVTSDRLNVDGILRIEESGVLTHFDSTTNFEPGLELTVGTLDVKTNGQINVDARGYVGGQNGNGLNVGQTINNTTGSTPRSAGSYGGLGGKWDGAGGPNAVYGDLTAPVDLGSGGSASTLGQVGGDGGGRMRIVAMDALLNGVVTANGGIPNGGNQAGSGSGGSIYITAETLSGAGTVRANGAAFEVGGGGGRVAIHYTTLNMTQGQFRALGGQGNFAKGGNGTVVFKGAGQALGDLYVDGGNVGTPIDSTPFPTNAYDNVFLINSARVVATSTIVASNGVQLLGGSILTHPSGLEAGLAIQAPMLIIDSNSAIDVSARGHLGGQQAGNPSNPGLTTNNTPGSTARSAGSYGGLGGAFDGVPNPIYGTATNPVNLGSGGSASGLGQAGGNGGGRVTLIVSGLISNDGAIRANGGTGLGNQAGSGSGGAIKISAGTFAGAGVLQSIGGGFQVGGGGGRIAVYAGTLNYDTNLATSAGGSGGPPGLIGTVFFGAPPAPPPGVLPSVPVITGLRFVPSNLPPPPDGSSTPSIPVLTWAVPGEPTGLTYIIEFSPSLLPWSSSTLGVEVSGSTWTGQLSGTTTSGFFRVRRP